MAQSRFHRETFGSITYLQKLSPPFSTCDNTPSITQLLPAFNGSVPILTISSPKTTAAGGGAIVCHTTDNGERFQLAQLNLPGSTVKDVRSKFAFSARRR
jgi:hypothetical protein